MNFERLGVEQPVFWAEFITWLRSDDARTVGAWLLEQHRTATPGQPGTQGTTPGQQPNQKPVGPVGILEEIDFVKAGVARPGFWDALLAWAKTEDGMKVLLPPARPQQGGRFAALAEELGPVDFTAAGIAKPAFWGDLLTWLKGDDAAKLARYLAARRPQQGPPPGNQGNGVQGGQALGTNGFPQIQGGAGQGRARGHTDQYGTGNNDRF